ncbi:hypothetical protein BC332_27951 [Capsicum chinense]|nr:hypothetical protein BC332_27951 [Capsicum chinense]
MRRTIVEAAHGSTKDPTTGYLKDTDTSEAKVPKKVIATTSDDWANLLEMDSDKEADTQLTSWKDNLRLNQINFDESIMLVLVCSYTGTPQP